MFQVVDAFNSTVTSNQNPPIVIIADDPDGHRLHLEVTGFCPSLVTTVQSSELTQDLIVDEKKEKFSMLCGYAPQKKTYCRYTAKVCDVSQLKNRLVEDGAVYKQLSVEKEMLLSANLNFGEWFTFKSRATTTRGTNTAVRYATCEFSDLRRIEHDVPANSGIAFFDIEASNKATGEFPNAAEGDEIECVVILVRGGPCHNMCFVLAREGAEWCTPDLPALAELGVVPKIQRCKSERDLLLRFAALMADVIRPTRIVAHNGSGFDWPFLFQAAARNRIAKFERRLSAFQLRPSTMSMSSYKMRVMRTNQLGAREVGDLVVRGLVVLDSMLYANRTFKLSSYSLNGVAAHVLGDIQKDDVKPREMFAAFNGTPPAHQVADGSLAYETCFARYRVLKWLKIEVLPEIAERVSAMLGSDDLQPLFEWRSHMMWVIMKYCARDVEVMALICEKINLADAIRSFANVVNLAEYRYATCGEQEKSMSLISRWAWTNNYIIEKSDLPPPEKYAGATVLEAQSGLYATPVIGVDFASLYPSIMQGWNLSYDTLLYQNHHRTRPDAYGLEEDDCHRFVLPCGRVVHFVKRHVRRGCLPIIVEDLLQRRKAIKKLMKKETDSFKKQLLDKMQLAMKVTANALYGFTGVDEYAMLSCHFVAQCITLQGRALIQQTKQYIERHPTWNCRVIYGDTDSCMVLPMTDSITRGDAWDLGEQIAEECTRVLYPEPVLLEMEKVMLPFLLKKKKMYVCMAYESKTGPGKRVAMGVDTARRDNPKWHRDVYSAVTDEILRELPFKLDDIIAGVHEVVRRMLPKLVNNSLPVSDYVTTKTIKRDDDYAAHQQGCKIMIPQVQAAKRLAQRIKDGLIAAEPPRPGDRVPFIMVVTAEDKAKRTDIAEHIDWVLHNHEEPDRFVYFEAWRESIASLLEPARVNDRFNLWTVPFQDGQSLDSLHRAWSRDLKRQIERERNSRKPALARKNGNRLLSDFFS